MKNQRVTVIGLIVLGMGFIGLIWYLVLRSPEGASAPIRQADIVANQQLVATGNQVLLEIDPSRSEARFFIAEILRGQDIVANAATQALTGQVAIDFTEPTNTKVGPVQVNARTLMTDNNFRNNAIRNRILFTDQYEFLTFIPKRLENLPEMVTVGETFTFEIVGDLTITTLTNEETFTVIGKRVSDTEIEATVATVLSRAHYELAVPSVPSVAWVDDAVQIELALVLVTVEPE